MYVAGGTKEATPTTATAIATTIRAAKTVTTIIREHCSYRERLLGHWRVRSSLLDQHGHAPLRLLEQDHALVHLPRELLLADQLGLEIEGRKKNPKIDI